MAKLVKSIVIGAPVEKVFAFMENPANLPEIWPSMVEVKNLQPAPAGGYNYDWAYKMAGVRLEGASETVEHVPNQLLVDRTTKGIDSEFHWTFQAEGAGTKLTVEVEYKVPIPVLGKLAESIIVKQNDKEADTLLANLKARMES
jgi:uncharacterized membrane protein